MLAVIPVRATPVRLFKVMELVAGMPGVSCTETLFGLKLMPTRVNVPWAAGML